MTAKEHNNLLGIFILIQGGLTVFIGLFLLLIYGGMGVALMGAGPDAEARFAGGMILVIGVIVGILLAYIMKPIVDRIQGLGIGRIPSILLTFVLVFGAISLLVTGALVIAADVVDGEDGEVEADDAAHAAGEAAPAVRLLALLNAFPSTNSSTYGRAAVTGRYRLCEDEVVAILAARWRATAARSRRAAFRRSRAVSRSCR